MPVSGYSIKLRMKIVTRLEDLEIAKWASPLLGVTPCTVDGTYSIDSLSKEHPFFHQIAPSDFIDKSFSDLTIFI
ncbi:MAG: hypothetical protein QNK40_11510 [Desulfobacterales bacterium]|nr:hypothetical protein [Desulfobacterales bacterium]